MTKCILIRWKTSERDYENIKATDFTVLESDLNMPTTDVNFNPQLGVNEELLIVKNYTS